MTRETQSQPSRRGLGLSLAMSIAIVFLAAAGALCWNTWTWEPHSPSQPVAPDLTHPVLVRAGHKSNLYHGSQNCKECHSKKKYKVLWKDWTKGGHKDVECEVCHGPGGDHARSEVEPPPKMIVTIEMLARPHVLCMGCHGKTPGRKNSTFQIEWEKHLAEFQVDKDASDYEKSRQCINCHDPHRPVKQ